MSNILQAQTQTVLRSSFIPVQTGILQRKCACGQHSVAGSECDECRTKCTSMMQRAAISSTTANNVPPIVHDVLSSPGQPLDAGARSFMESRFSHDFSGVRVHNDARAAESARSINALAYTVGRDVVFGAGQYAPGSLVGKKLLAHELTHVVQQAGIRHSAQQGLQIGRSAGTYEQEAHFVANAISSMVSSRPGGSDKSSLSPLASTITKFHPIAGSSIVQRDDVGGASSADVGATKRYPVDAQAWQDVELYPIVEDQLPTDIFSLSSGTISSGIYRIHPLVRNHDDPHVVYYAAYNTRAQRTEYAIGPAYLDFFLQHTTLYMIAAGNFFGILGHPSPHEVSTGKVISRGIRGDILGAVRALGQSWLQALQNPNWLVQALGATAGMAAPETEAASIEGKAATRELPASGPIHESLGTATEAKVVAAAEEEVLTEGPVLPKPVGAAADISVESKIGKSTYAIRQAEAMSEAAQADVDNLLAQFKKGNANPGIGTRSLGDGFYELRGRNAGRVIVKQKSAGSFDIVGKFQGHARGAAANSAIIKNLIKEYKP
jgi:Domain of unknown function (DUF4157)